MDNQLIEKIITSNNLPCPKFTFENPLLDKNVAKALSESFVKILNLSQQNSKVNNNLRISILEKIRKMCQTEPENHMHVDENATTFLLEAYEDKMKELSIECSDTTNKVLDEFLVRNMNDMTINSSFKSSLDPETLQAYINLNENSVHNSLFKDIIHWDSSDAKSARILKDLFLFDDFMVDDVSIKLKAEIEKELLDICYNVLVDTEGDIEELFNSNMSLKNFVQKSSESSICFQMCCHILNYVFVMTNFATKIQTFVQTFVENVKKNTSYLTISVLYPKVLSNTVLFLDIDVEQLPESVKNDYITHTVKCLCELQSTSETDLLMLLSHFPQWFDIYFNSKIM